MDAQALVISGVGLCTILGAGIAIGRKQRVVVPPDILKPVQDDLKGLDGKVHRLANWRDGLTKELTAEFVPRRELALELKPIHDSLRRIEDSMARLSGTP